MSRPAEFITRLTRGNSEEPGMSLSRHDMTNPPGGLPLDLKEASCKTSAHEASSPTTEYERKIKKDDESLSPSKGDAKSDSEASIQNLAQWRKLIRAIERKDLEVSLQLLDLYSAFLKKESNYPRVITLLAKAIRADMDVCLQKVLTLVPLSKIEKEFTFQYLMLPMAYALRKNASPAILITLYLSKASLFADYDLANDCRYLFNVRVGKLLDHPDFSASPPPASTDFLLSFALEKMSQGQSAALQNCEEGFGYGSGSGSGSDCPFGDSDPDATTFGGFQEVPGYR